MKGTPMAFKEVLCSLEELFPQVDTRILKAVAMEHSKDIDAAVEFIVSDILPVLEAPSNSLRGVSTSEEVFDASNEVEQSKHASSEDEGAMFTMDQRTIACDMVSNGNKNPSSVENVVLVDEQPSSSRDQGAAERVSVNYWESNSMHVEDGGSSGSASNSEHHSSYVQAPGLETEENILNQVGSFSQYDASPSHNDNKVGGSSSMFPSECLASVKHIMAEDTCPPLTVATRSGQIVKADMLEEFINDAKTYKKILVSTVESVLDLAKMVDDREREALEAKEKSSKAGLDTLAKVDDLKKTLTHAMEANHMQAGEVYGERSILATEVRELQSRLLVLADEKEKSLSVIGEIHKTLEARLATAEEEKMVAEKVKLEKEGNAFRELTDQTVIMDKLVEESKRLKQESEENQKLSEFLMDRGRIVDTLRGEISVICEDVRSLKERVDKHLPIDGLKYSGGSALTSVSAFSNVEVELVNPAGPPVRGDVPILNSKPQDSKLTRECSLDVESFTSMGDLKVSIESVASADDRDIVEPVASADDRNIVEPVASADDRDIVEPVVSADDRDIVEPVASADDHEVAESVASADDQKVVKSVASADDQKVVKSINSGDDSKVTFEEEWELFEDVDDLRSVPTV